MANTKNYRKQGGEEWIIGGKMEVESGGEVDVKSGGAFKMAGTSIAASAQELNRLQDVTPGTAAANKAVVLDGDKKIDEMDPTALKINGGAVSATAEELNKLSGAGANVTASNLDALTGGSDVDKAAGGHGHLLAAGASDVTATAAELNALQNNVEAVAALVAAGLGVSQGVSQTDHAATPVAVVAADAGGNRACLIAAVCTTTVAGSTKPTFNLGEADGAADKFFAEGTLENSSAGDVFVSAGVLTDNKAMQCAVTEGADAGEAPAGAFDFLVLLLPVA